MLNKSHYFDIRRERLARKLPITVWDYSHEIQHIRKLLNYNIKEFDKVIIIGNEDSPIIIGYFIKHYQFTEGSSLPLIRDLTGSDFYTFGQVFKYSNELYKELLAYHPIERFNIVCSSNYFISKYHDKEYKTYRVKKVIKPEYTNETEKQNLLYNYIG